MEKSKTFYAKIFGDRALITMPETKSGGEKYSYQVPTREMLRGILDSNYFKPTLINVVDEVRIMKPIETEFQGIRLLKSNYKSDLSSYTYLTNVCYYVKYHFEWNMEREDLVKDRNMKKHEEITERSLKRGGRRPIFLGVSECMGYIEELTESDYEQDPGYYDNTNIGFGIMFVGFLYPQKSGELLRAAYAPIRMQHGRIVYPKPEDCTMINEVGHYTFKEPALTKTVEEELEEDAGGLTL